MPQIALVPNKHDHNIGIGMISELLQPTSHIVVGLVLADIVDKQRANRSTIVGRSDCAVSLLTCSVPDLRLDCLCVNLNRPCRKFNADRRFGIEVELVSSESAQQVGFSDSGVTNEDNWERVNSVRWTDRDETIYP